MLEFHFHAKNPARVVIRTAAGVVTGGVMVPAAAVIIVVIVPRRVMIIAGAAIRTGAGTGAVVRPVMIGARTTRAGMPAAIMPTTAAAVLTCRSTIGGNLQAWKQGLVSQHRGRCKERESGG